MLGSNWSHNVLGMTRLRRDRRSKAAALQRRVRLRLEPLEDRVTPSVTPLHTVSHTPDPHIAVANALASETATTTYLLQILNSYTTIVGGAASTSSPINGSTLTVAEQNAIIDTLAALSREFLAIGQELSSLNLPPNEVALWPLILQQQLSSPAQSQGTQQASPTSYSIPVGAITN